MGFEAEELIGKRAQDIFLKGKMDKISQHDYSEEVINSETEKRFLVDVITKSGEEKQLEVWLKPIIKGETIVAIQSVCRNVTARESLMKYLKQALTKERELSELKSTFVSNASHQFRKPLTVIQSGVEIMEMYIEDLPEDKQAKFQRQFLKMQEEINRLSDLMNDVLLLGRANATRTPFEPKAGSLVEYCQSIVNNKYNSLQRNERQIKINVEGLEVPVLFDKK